MARVQIGGKDEANGDSRIPGARVLNHGNHESSPREKQVAAGRVQVHRIDEQQQGSEDGWLPSFGMVIVEIPIEIANLNWRGGERCHLLEYEIERSKGPNRK